MPDHMSDHSLNADPAARSNRRPASQMTAAQRGLMAAILAAFFGIVFGGPALTRASHKRRRVQARLVHQTREVRARAHKAGKAAHRKLRRLGGGTIWR